MVPWCLARKFAAGTDEEVTSAGGVIDTSRNVVIFQRFCHVYRRGELEELLRSAGGLMGLEVIGLPEGSELPAAAASASGATTQSHVLRIEASWWDKDNWCVIARRGGASASSMLL